MNINERTERLITVFLRIVEKYPIIAITIVIVLGILLFLSSVEAGEHIGDAILG